jgi:hypothetical protein
MVESKQALEDRGAYSTTRLVYQNPYALDEEQFRINFIAETLAWHREWLPSDCKVLVVLEGTKDQLVRFKDNVQKAVSLAITIDATTNSRVVCGSVPIMEYDFVFIFPDSAGKQSSIRYLELKKKLKKLATLCVMYPTSFTRDDAEKELKTLEFGKYADLVISGYEQLFSKTKFGKPIYGVLMTIYGDSSLLQHWERAATGVGSPEDGWKVEEFLAEWLKVCKKHVGTSKDKRPMTLVHEGTEWTMEIDCSKDPYIIEKLTKEAGRLMWNHPKGRIDVWANQGIVQIRIGRKE